MKFCLSSQYLWHIGQFFSYTGSIALYTIMLITNFSQIPFLMMSKTMDFLFIPGLSDETLCSLDNLSNRHIYPNKFMFTSSLRRCKESHFSMVHDWGSSWSQQEPCRHIPMQHFIYNHTYCKPNTWGPLLLHWKYWEDFYCKEDRFRGQLMQDTAASAMPSALRQSSPEY